MSPEEIIASLDNSLAISGEDVILRRKTGTGNNIVNVDVACRASVRAVSTEEIAAGIKQTDLNLILSPSQINAAQWPGGQAPTLAAPFDADPRIPLIGQDNVIVQQRLRTVTFVDAVVRDGTLVRINLRVTG